MSLYECTKTACVCTHARKMIDRERQRERNYCSANRCLDYFFFFFAITKNVAMKTSSHFFLCPHESSPSTVAPNRAGPPSKKQFSTLEGRFCLSQWLGSTSGFPAPKPREHKDLSFKQQEDICVNARKPMLKGHNYCVSWGKSLFCSQLH